MKELSLVMSIGNNNYGSVVRREVEPAVPTSAKKRAEYSLYTLQHAFRNIDYELVIVEWCGKEEGEGPSDWDFVKEAKARIIRVPYEFTRTVSPERAFHEGHAKNIGVRRTMGRMILTLNPDCLWVDEFPKACLACDGVMIANRPTVYHTIMDIPKDIALLKEFCGKPENVVHTHDWNANGDFTLMHRDIWYQLQGLSTPKGTSMAGVDMWQIARAEQLVRRPRSIYPYNIIHIRHPGSPLESGYGQTITSDNWGFPNENFEELQ
jgi:hypothetical protein